MKKMMSLESRREMLLSIRATYNNACKPDKTKILDGFVAATNYDRKYAIQLLTGKVEVSADITPKKRPGAQVYDEKFLHALTIVWNTANQICSKRLVPFIPQLVNAMERHGHLRVTSDIREKLLKISPATVDRLLQNQRRRNSGGISRTKAGSLLKNQIQVRTFADWDDVSPGFFEVDLVAHCGGDPNGAFLNTLTMVDIATGWLECMPLLKKSASDVITGRSVAKKLMPFELKGLDTDGGSEFINHEVLEYCEKNAITFTRTRTHKKNDQAFVEEKNGSVVRRLIGYDRFQGAKAWSALANFYKVLRKYINFFQPSLKLSKKSRQGGRVSKTYHKAKTPYQRLCLCKEIPQAIKNYLEAEFLALDPVYLMQELQRLQQELMKFAWQTNGKQSIIMPRKTSSQAQEKSASAEVKVAIDYFRYEKPKDKRSLARTYKTRKDPFADVWPEIQLKLELQPESYAREIIDWLSIKYPGQYYMGQIRTLQRRIHEWRLKDQGYQAKMNELMN